jgi:AcrR family transcriptional regulator
MQTEIFFPHGAALATRFSEPVDAMRRRPRQKRSRATIDSILDATAQVLDRRGWSGFTTNVVADVAGVSIGSLYQYFPNKLGLIEALRRRHFDDVRAALRAVTDSDPSPAMHIEAFVDGVIAAHSRHPGAHHAMLEEAPHSAEARDAHEAFAAWYALGCQALLEHCRAAGESAIDDDARMPIATRVLASAVAGVVHDAAAQGILHAPALRRELIALVASICGYRSESSPPERMARVASASTAVQSTT